MPCVVRLLAFEGGGYLGWFAWRPGVLMDLGRDLAQRSFEGTDDGVTAAMAS
jgi:hypothetical protein